MLKHLEKPVMLFQTLRQYPIEIVDRQSRKIVVGSQNLTVFELDTLDFAPS